LNIKVPKVEIILLLLSLVLIFSLSANLFLIDKAVYYYKSLNLLRLDPLEHKTEKDNKVNISAEEGSPVIILYGDSRIAQWHPKLLIPGATIINKGLEGQTTAQLRLRLESDVIANSPDMVIFQAGINDLKTIGLFPKHKEAIITNCKQNLEFIIKQISNQNIDIVVLTIFPNGKPELIRSWLWSDEIDNGVVLVNNSLLKMSNSKIHVINADNFLKAVKYIRPHFKKDMLHLNQAGYQQLNDQLQPNVLRLLSK